MPYKITSKTERRDAIDVVKAKVIEALCDDENDEAPATSVVGDVFKKVEASIVRGQIIETSTRIDGRDLSTVRQIKSEVGTLPRTHGSALFTRGETQGHGLLQRSVRAMTSSSSTLWKAPTRKPSCCTTTSPPYSVGEAGRCWFYRSP